MGKFGRKRVIVIGGNAAGMTAASRLRRLDAEAEVTVLERSAYISYSICGTPYLLEGLVGSHLDLLAFTPEAVRSERGIEVRTECEATQISIARREIQCRDLRSRLAASIPFDSVVVATGYQPSDGSIVGADHRGVFKISQLEDVIRLNRFLDTGPRTAVVVGGGYVGLNTAEALSKRGLSVTLLERADQVFPAVDPPIASMVERECRAGGVQILLLTPAEQILSDAGRPVAVQAGGRSLPADLVVVDVGIRPNVDLACQAGLRIGAAGGISVSPRMETSQDGIYAAGNCAETTHLITARPVTSALGTHAVKQGRVAGENIAGVRSEFPGVLQTSVTRFFGLSVGRTGLSEQEARGFGFDCSAVSVETPSRAAYYGDAEKVTFRLIFDCRTLRLLGAQTAGAPWTAKRIDVAAAAITGGMTLSQIAQLDLAYSPPHAPLWDPLQVAANAALRQLR